MKTVTIKIPAYIIPGINNPQLVAVCELRKWCREHIRNGWHSYFLTSPADILQDKQISFAAFNFTDPKEALKFQLWAGNEY